MKTKTQERILVGAMTAIVLLLLWILAAWAEVHSHTSRPRALTFAESHAPILSSLSTPTPNETIPVAPVVQRRTPELPESIKSERSLVIPNRSVQSSALQVQPNRTALNPVRRRVQMSSTSVSSRGHSKSSNIEAREPSRSEQLQPKRRHSPQFVTAVPERQQPPTVVLEREHQSSEPMNRVLQAEEARAIIQWMRITESELPSGIKRHIDYQPGNLSSVTHLEYEGDLWEIYLMARMPSEELHVVIVKGNLTYYVVDPSFKREGRRFRVGIARRSGNEIIGITSEERAASSTDAVLHYDVFLAWWDKMQLTLQ